MGSTCQVLRISAHFWELARRQRPPRLPRQVAAERETLRAQLAEDTRAERAELLELRRAAAIAAERRQDPLTQPSTCAGTRLLEYT